MKNLLIKYKPVLKFVALFLGTYFVLSFLYGWYLNISEGGKYYPDFVTNIVADQSSKVIDVLGYPTYVMPDDIEPVMRLYVENIYLAKIIEGCNSISVIILFMAFIISFSENFKKTFLFILTGATLIYAANILRIVILSIALYHYPQYENILHTVVFPSIIYGMTFALWLLWIKLLPKPNNSNNG